MSIYLCGKLNRENLKARGVDPQQAEWFFEGLTISRKNKLSIQEAIYQNHSPRRYLTRPILINQQKGEERAIIGQEKWRESIVVLATNALQWQVAPEEWKRNAQFSAYLNKLHDEHNKILEDEAQKIFIETGLFFDRNLHGFKPRKGSTITIDKTGIGEIDFLLIDKDERRIIVADCKYLRARYEMVGYSRDFSNFIGEYETKINNKLNWVQQNLTLVREHFEQQLLGESFDLSAYHSSALFITNTPTFYMLCSPVHAVNSVSWKSILITTLHCRQSQLKLITVRRRIFPSLLPGI